MITKRPSGIERNRFLPWWKWAKDNFEYLLETDLNLFVKGGKQKSISKLLLRSVETYFNGHGSGAVDLAHLINLVEDLDFLRINNDCIFRDYKSKLLSVFSNDFPYLTGLWFEIRIAKLLTLSGFQYNQPDPPDFSILINGVNIGIECYAPRIDIGGDVKQKLYNIIKKKGEKYRGQAWLRNPSVLILDITWIIRAAGAAVVSSENPLSKIIENGLKDVIVKTPFDLILAFWFGHASVKHRNVNSISCVHVQIKIQDPMIDVFREKLLGSFYVLEREKIQLPNLPKD